MDMAPHAKVIMLSIYEDAAYQADAAAAGIFAYVPKRKMGSELIPMITRLLRGLAGQRIEDPAETEERKWER
jgi:DNA-binding NarL/FixJ family response regulator